MSSSSRALPLQSFYYSRDPNSKLQIFHLKLNAELLELFQAKSKPTIRYQPEPDNNMMSIYVGERQFSFVKRDDAVNATVVSAEGNKMVELGSFAAGYQIQTDVNKCKQMIKSKYQEQADERTQKLTEAGNKRGISSTNANSANKLRRVSNAIVIPSKSTTTTTTSSSSPDSLQNRIIHMLALHKKLSLDEVHEKCQSSESHPEKSQVKSVLENCGVVDGGKWTLKGSMWQQVRPHWAGYTIEESNRVKKMMTDVNVSNKTSNNNSNGNNNGSSPDATFSFKFKTPFQNDLVARLQKEPKIVQIKSNEERENLKSVFRDKYEVYVELDRKLEVNKAEFERYEAELNQSTGEARENMQKIIQKRFNEIKDDVRRCYTAFVNLHKELENDKVQLKKRFS